MVGHCCARGGGFGVGGGGGITKIGERGWGWLVGGVGRREVGSWKDGERGMEGKECRKARFEGVGEWRMKGIFEWGRWGWRKRRDGGGCS